jgi:hypothetical protein
MRRDQRDRDAEGVPQKRIAKELSTYENIGHSGSFQPTHRQYKTLDTNFEHNKKKSKKLCEETAALDEQLAVAGAFGLFFLKTLFHHLLSTPRLFVERPSGCTWG